MVGTKLLVDFPFKGYINIYYIKYNINKAKEDKEAPLVNTFTSEETDL